MKNAEKYPTGAAHIPPMCYMDSDALRRSATLPDTVQSIGRYAFASADGSDRGEPKMDITLTLPADLDEVGAYCFSENRYLNKVMASEKVWRLLLGATGSLSFTGIEKAEIPEGCTHIAPCVFLECEHLRGVRLPEGLKSVGDHAFTHTSLAELRLPASLQHVGAGAFSHIRSCKKLVAGPEQWPLLLGECQISCIGVEEACLPDTVERIGNMAFAHCEALRRVVLPPSLADCGTDVFAGCNALSDIYILGDCLSAKAYPWDAPKGAVWHVRESMIPIIEKMADGKGVKLRLSPLPESMLAPQPCGNATFTKTIKGEVAHAEVSIGYEVEPDHIGYLAEYTTAMAVYARYCYQGKKQLSFATCQNKSDKFPFQCDAIADTAYNLDKDKTYIFVHATMDVKYKACVKGKGAFRPYKLRFAKFDSDTLWLNALYYDGERMDVEVSTVKGMLCMAAEHAFLVKQGQVVPLAPSPSARISIDFELAI